MKYISFAWCYLDRMNRLRCFPKSMCLPIKELDVPLIRLRYDAQYVWVLKRYSWSTQIVKLLLLTIIPVYMGFKKLFVVHPNN